MEKIFLKSSSSTDSRSVTCFFVRPTHDSLLLIKEESSSEDRSTEKASGEGSGDGGGEVSRGV